MTFDVAKKAIDYYIANFNLVSKRNPLISPTVGFYGGEPLINFELIKKIVEYLKVAYKGTVNYNVTVNGSLFDEEIQNFLVSNNFAILVSLDGDKNNHDRNRVKEGNAGTFDEILNNIRIFKKNHPDYYKFGISGCYDLKTNFSEVEKFFTAEDLFVMNYTQVEVSNTTYYSNFSQKDLEEFFKSYNNFEKKFSDFATKYKGSEDIRKFLYSMIGRKYLDFSYHSVMNECRSSISPFTGTCIPGEKLYVTADGKMHICERINHNLPIGDVDSGLDFDHIAKLVNQYNEKICAKCSSCNAKKYCSLCLAKAASKSEFCISENYCKDFEDSVKGILRKFVSLLENNPKLFEKITVDYYTKVLDMVGEQF